MSFFKSTNYRQLIYKIFFQENYVCENNLIRKSITDKN